jgi:uncharacterized membrane protein
MGKKLSVLSSEERASSPVIRESLICGVGIFLAVYTVLLKVAALPCVSGDCHKLIHSSYGTFWGIPVGLYALIFWSILLTKSGWPSRLARVGLVLGSIYFIGVQAFALKMFCPVCGAHALVCLLTMTISADRRRSALIGFVAVAAAFCVIVWSEQQARNRLQEQLLSEELKPVEESVIVAAETLPVVEIQSSDTSLSVDSGLSWLSSETLLDTQVVISFTCNQCLSVLETILAQSNEDRRMAGIILKVDPGSRAITRTLLAAVLSRSDLPSHVAFGRAFGLLVGDKDVFFRNDETTASFLLGAEFPALSNFLDEADIVLNEHESLLQSMGVSQTPTVLKKGAILAYAEDLIAEP